ncbi:CBBY-like protein (AtCbby) [Durusdinium trenchii]|uniref:CBBY-like protein (AtCbby) n=1 Tax=Durusdinium trenchii TaxID=1381693 RepID=A0ABP0LPQ0_9DINO
MRRRNWSRVSLGPSGGCFYDMKFRAKPGDKFKYRYSTDVWEPEWGIIPEEKGRLIRYGQRFRKGTVVKPMVDDDDDDDAWPILREIKCTGALLLDCDGTLAETERDGHRVAFNKAFEEKGFDVEWDVELYGELLTTGGGKERMTRYFKDYNPKAWIFEDRRSNAGFDKSMSALMCFVLGGQDPPAKDHPVIMELHELKTRIFMEIVKSGDLPLREGIKADLCRRLRPEDLISAADEAGWQLAVCSTSNEASVTAVVETMLPDFAPKMRIFAGDVVSAKKPDPVPGTEHPETSGDRAIYKLASEKLGVAPMRCVVIEDTSIGATAGNAAGMKVGAGLCAASLADADEAKSFEKGSIEARWCSDWLAELMNKMTPSSFIQYVTLLSTEDHQENLYMFMSSMSMELTWSQVQARLVKIEAVLDGDDFSILFHQPMDFGSKMDAQDFQECDVSCYKSEFSITPLAQLFNCSNRDLALLLKVLADAGQDSLCFNTVCARAILAECHKRTARGHWVDIIIDFLYICMLIRMSMWLETGNDPEAWLLACFALLSVWIAASLFFKLFGGLILFCGSSAGLAVGFLKHLNLWSVTLTATEVFSAYVGWRFMVYACVGGGVEVNDAWAARTSVLFQKHPAFLSVLVLIRWTQVGFGLLQLPGIGRNIVPVFYAITRINFLFILFIIVMGSFHAYFVFPIKENTGKFDNIFNGFLKIFRLEVLGDFDLNELEGLSETLSANLSHGHLQGEVGEEVRSHIHRSLRLEFLVLSLLVTVVAMNVYIGLLGELYSKAVERKNRLYNHYLAASACRYLSRLVGFRWLCCGGRCSQRPTDKEPGLVWLAYRREFLLDSANPEEC